MTKFDPPRYTLTADTTAEALRALEAARNLIDSHLSALHPGEGSETARSRCTDPIAFRLELDLTALVQAVNEESTLRALDPEVGL